jgi:hypothetical protein
MAVKRDDDELSEHEETMLALEGLPFVGGAFSGPRQKRMREAYNGIEQPEYSDQDYFEMPYAGDYTPEMYDTPEAANYETISEDPRLREIQLAALEKMSDQAMGLADAKGNAARFAALDDANQLAQGREGAIRAEAERTGQGGAGLGYVMRQQAAQGAANRARGGTLDAVTAAALEKMAAQEGAMRGGDMMRSRDADVKARNADIINQFNMFNVKARNAARMAGTDMRNQATLRNSNVRQDILGKNTGIRNMSLDRKDGIADKKFGNAMRWTGAKYGAQNDAAAQTAANRNSWEGLIRDGIGMASAGMMKDDEDDKK